MGLLLFLVLCALRLPWLEADGGNYSFWAYGFFSTDEGYYTTGGRLAYLTGRLLDPELNEPVAFLFSWGMHALGYLGYCLAGLNWAAARWPTMVAAICGWLAVFVLVSRRTSTVLAGVIVLLVSCNPASLTYERVASSDVIVGALSVTAFALATSRRQWLTVAAGVVMAVALSVKLTALGLLPLLLLGAWSKSHRRRCRLVLLGLALAAAFPVSLALRQACIQAAARASGMAEVVKALSLQIFEPMQLTPRFMDCLKAVFVFPRCPISLQLGPFILWCFALPMFCVLLVGLRTWRLPDRRTAVPIGALVYLAICSTQASGCIRYLLPVLYLAPVLVVDARALAPRRIPDSNGRWSIMTLAIAALFTLYWLHPRHTTQQLEGQLYNEYALPAQGPWIVAGLPLAAGILVMAIALHFCLRDRVSLKRNALVAGFGFAFVWSFFNNYTVSLMRFSAMFMRSQLVFQFCLCALCAALFVGGRLRAAKPWYLLHAVILLAFLVGNGFWSSAYPDLWARRFNTREASLQLEQLIPPDAIVIGRRATTLLRASQARLGMTTSNYQPKEFVEKVAYLLDKYPSHPLYWLVDGDKNSSWQWNAYLQQGQEQWKVRLAATVSIATGDVFSTGDMPDADDLMLVPVYLFRVTKVPLARN